MNVIQNKLHSTDHITAHHWHVDHNVRNILLYCEHVQVNHVR